MKLKAPSLPAGPPSCDPQEVRAALALLLEPDTWCELRRILDRDRGADSVRLLSSQLDELTAWAVSHAKAGQGIYYCLNPLATDPGREARDGDVMQRRWLLVDIDRRKSLTPEHKDDSATEEEKALCLAVANAVMQALFLLGWGWPVRIDSGNGYHLLYRIKEDNSEAARDMLRACLCSLADRFDTDTVEIDRKVFNASRIAKLPGTMARKGVSTPERPHRMAHLLESPGPAQVVEHNFLRMMAEDVEKAQRPAPPSRERGLVLRATDGRADAYVNAALEHEVGRMALTARGHLNDQLFKSAAALGNFVPHLLDEDQVFEAILAAGERAGCDNPRKDEDTIRRAIKRGMTTPRFAPGLEPSVNGTGHQSPAAEDPWEPPIPLYEIPRAAPFPLDALPPPLRAFAREVSCALACPVDFVAAPLLALAGGAIGNSRRLGITDSHTQSACLFVVVVGSPGSGKSPALDLLARPFEKAEQVMRQPYKDEVKAWKKKDEETRGERPTLKRLVVDDVTSERLVGLLSENPRGLVMIRDELAALVTSMNQYKAGGKGSDRQNFLKLWAGSRISVDRKSNPDGLPQMVHHPFLGVVGGIQPDIVGRLRDPQGDDGFMDRFLPCHPDETPACEERWLKVGTASCAVWADAVDALLALEMVKDEEGGVRPFVVKLSEGGRVAWQEFTRAHAAELNDEDFPALMKGTWAKLKGYCGRLALVLHCLSQACGGPQVAEVQGETVRAAALLVDYFKAHARRLAAAGEADRETPKCKLVLRWIERKGAEEFKAWEVLGDLSSQGKFPTVDALLPTLDRLVRSGYLRVKIPPPKAGPGRKPTTTYQVNPNHSIAGKSGESGE